MTDKYTCSKCRMVFVIVDDLPNPLGDVGRCRCGMRFQSSTTPESSVERVRFADLPIAAQEARR